MSQRRREEFIERLKEAVNKNNTVATEIIIQEYVELVKEPNVQEYLWPRLCELALKNRCLPMLELLLPQESIANKFIYAETNKQLMKVAVESDFVGGVKFLHSKGVPLYFPKEGPLSSWNSLIESVETYKPEVLKYLLGVKNLDKNPYQEKTLVMSCCDQLKIESLKILLKSDLINTINQQTKDLQQSALHFCIGKSYYWSEFGIMEREPERVFDCVHLLVEAGADVNLQDIYGKTPIHLAAERGMVTMVIYFAQRGANLDIRNHQDTLLCCIAGSKGKVDSYDEYLQLLITNGMDINKVNSSNKTPLYLAVCKGNEEMVKSLIKSNCDVNIKVGNNMESVLMESIRRQETTIAEILIEAGCDFNTTDKNGVTPLMECVEAGNNVLVQRLIEHGALVNAKDNKGWFVLDYLFRSYSYLCHPHLIDQSSAGVIKMLIEAGADIHKCDNLLCRAIKKGHYESASLLIEHGIDVNTVDENGDNPLTLASKQGNVAFMTLLTSTECDINHQNLKGKTALHNAIRVKRYCDQTRSKVIEILLQNGMNVNLGDVDGETALSIAVAAQNVFITKILLKAGAEVNCFDKRRRTPLMTAARTCNRSILECLLNAGADVNKTDTDGRSAIHCIMVGSRDRGRKWINCLKLLLMNKCHVSLDTPGENRNTLLKWLLETNEADLIWYLVTENCSLKSLDLRKVKEKINFHNTSMLSNILFESGAQNDDIISSFDTGVSFARCVSFQAIFEAKYLDEFRNFCKSRSLKSRCRREIRNCIGPGISSKITQVGLPQCLQDYVVMKDLIPEKYFTLVLNDRDDNDSSDDYYSTDDSSDLYYSTEEEDDYIEEDCDDYYYWSD
ncbi:hypothetical protein SNE40_020557 [Patella caerulea]|uniref:SOCS box domain-containing protein n=1 Tax=Patella caerulea TaxID=87958 RepID=A0AAN8J4P3_PATCE